MNSKNISFRLVTSAIVPQEWTENGKKYLLLEFPHFEYHVFVSDKGQGILILEDDNSAIVNQIKKNNQEYWIENEGGGIVIKHKSGRKHWKDGFYWGKRHKQEWAEIEAVLKKSSPQQKGSQSQKEKKWYNPADYPGTWIAAVFLSLFLAIVIFVLIRKAKKKKKKKKKKIIFKLESKPKINNKYALFSQRKKKNYFR